jgi:glycosyltransferase involved in cell wall biosynthesis
VRIAWIVYGDLAQATGGYGYDRLLVEGLRDRGNEVELFDPLVATAGCERADVTVGDALCVRELGPLFESVACAAPRVLLVHHLPSWELERSDGASMRRYEARALAASDHVVATSNASRLRLQGDCAGVPVDVVVPGADRLPRYPRSSSSDVGGGRVELLFVGSLVPRKRVALLLDALESLGAEPSRPVLTLLGDPGREPEYARAIADRIEASVVLRSSVTAVGVVDDDVLARWLARADALVLPSSLEGYGMVLTEALHAGLPVIAARPAAVAAAIDALDAVRTFDDGADLTEVVRRFVRSMAQREAMGHAASALALPSWSDAIAAFGHLLANARRRRP